MKTGTIIRGVGGFYDVICDNVTIRCRARGRFRNQGMIPLVGDHVLITEGSDTTEAAIEEILPRKNELIRPPVSNIDYLAIVVTAINPEPDLLLIDKLLIAAELNNIKPALVINKIDLVTQEQIDELAYDYKKAGYKIYYVSTKNSIGIDELSKGLSDGVTTLAGQSGVGKSSIINALNPSVSFKTGDISVKLKRGKHTTRHVELLPLPYGGRIVDTPGFNQMDMLPLKPEELQYYYPEFDQFISQCKFSSCLHRNEPECAVRSGVEKDLISIGRYNRYIRLLQDLCDRRRFTR